jgi:hypothetical protein
MEKGEYVNSWGDIVNQNLDKLDTAVGTLQSLTQGAEGGHATIDTRLDAMDVDLGALEAMTVLKEPYYIQGGSGDSGKLHYGASHATDGMDAAGRYVGALGHDISELRGTVQSKDHSTGAAGNWINQTAGTNANTSGAIGLLIASGRSGAVFSSDESSWFSRSGDDEVRVGNASINEDVLVSVRGQLGIIRSTDTQAITAVGQGANERWHLLATGINDAASAATRYSGADGVISGPGSSVLTSITLGDPKAVAPGDLLILSGAPQQAIAGTYIIDSLANGTVTILGTFNTDGLTGVTWALKRRYEVALDLAKEGAAAGEVGRTRGGDAYDLTGQWVGTSLASHHTTDPGAVFAVLGAHAGGPVIHAFGDTYDSGWVTVTSLFTGGSFHTGDPVYLAIPIATVGGFEVVIEETSGERSSIRGFYDQASGDGFGINAYLSPDVGGINCRTTLAIAALDLTKAHMSTSSDHTGLTWLTAAVVKDLKCRVTAWRT